MALLKLSVQQFIERGITVLFEGLEEEHQITFCNEIGVQLMQGFALARPEIVPTTFGERFPEIDREAEASGNIRSAVVPPLIPSLHMPSSSDRAAKGPWKRDSRAKIHTIIWPPHSGIWQTHSVTRLPAGGFDHQPQHAA
jgi:hypothetical protein